MADKIAGLVIKVDSQGVKAAADRLDMLTRKARATDKALGGLNTKSVKTSTATKQVARGADTASRSIRSMGRNVDVTAKGLEGIVKRSLAAGAAFIAFNQLQRVTRFTFETTAAFERLDKQLTFVTGSARGAGEAMGFIRAEAQRTGQSVLDIAPSFAKLQFAMEQAGLSADDTKAIFQGVNSAAATFALSQADVNGILRAFIQVASKGTVQAEELRGQIGERIPGAFGLAARSMGKTTAELGKMLELGQVTANEMIPKLAQAMNEAFGQGIEDKTNTITAAVGRLKTEVQLLVEQVEASDNFRDFIEGVTKVVSSVRVTQGEKIAEDLRTAFSPLEGAEKNVEAVRSATERLGRASLSDLQDALETIRAKAIRAREQLSLNIGNPSDIADVEAYERATRTVLRSIEELKAAESERTEFNRVLANTRTNALDTASSIENLAVQLGSVKNIFDLLKEGGGLGKPLDFFDVTGLHGSITEQLRQAGTAGIEVNLANPEELQNRVTNALDFSNVETATNPFTKVFESLRKSLVDSREKIDQEYSRSRDAIVGYFKETNQEISEEGRNMLRELDNQYAQDVSNWQDAQRRKLIASSGAAQAVVSSTQAIEDALVNAAREGKTAFSDLFQFVAAEIQRVAIRALVLRPLFNFLGNSLSGVFPAVGAAFLEAASPPKAVGGFIPSGEVSMVGEAGPEFVKGPAVVTSTKSTADKLSASGGSPRFTFVNNINAANMRGPDVARLEQVIENMNRNFKQNVMATVQNAYSRKPTFMTR